MVVTFGFNEESPKNFSTTLGQHDQPTKATAPKAKGANPDLGGGSTSYLVE
jgi:hypothetical protein